MTTEDPRDPDLTAAYGALARAEPPARLDDAILAASRRAVHAGPQRSLLQRWRVPVSLAAAVVLSVMVTLRVQHERPDLEAPVAQAPAPAAKSEPALASLPPVSAESKLAPRAGESQRNVVVGVEPPRDSPRAPEGRRAAPSDDARRDQRFVPEPPRDAPRAAAPLTRAPATAPSTTTPPAEQIPTPPLASAPAAAPAPAPAAPGAAAIGAMQSLAKESAAAASADSSAGQGPERRAMAQAAPPAPRALPRIDDGTAPASVTGPASGAGAREQAAAARERAQAGERRELARAAPDRAGISAKLAEDADTPERQLERIAKLRAEGKHAEADRLLAEFRRNRPEYRIPDEMLERVLPPR